MRSVCCQPWETAAVVIDARAGVQTVASKMMEIAQQRGMARLVVVNKIDADDVDLNGVMEGIIEAFGSECLPINLPAGGGTKVVDCFFNPSSESPDISDVETAHTQIVDQVVEMDEDLMEAYLEQGEDLAPERLHDAFESALREGHLVPVCFTSGETGVGVNELLDIISKVMPSPLEANPPTFTSGSELVEVTGESDKPVISHVFKLTIDSFVGRMGIFRIHQGTVKKDTQLLIGEARKPFKVGHLLKLQGKESAEVEEGVAGDICALAKVEELALGSVLPRVA